MTPRKTPKFVAYLRVSTDKQGRSGPGMEAQREAVDTHIAATGGNLVSVFIEVESGKKGSDERPKLAAALHMAKVTGSKLLIAKLDRLSRNVAFIAKLQESRVQFVCADMPDATELTVHILAAIAQHERSMISSRTKAALQPAKARGAKLSRQSEWQCCFGARGKGQQSSRQSGQGEGQYPCCRNRADRGRYPGRGDHNVQGDRAGIE